MSKCLVYTDPQSRRACVVVLAPTSRLLLPREGFPPILEPEAYWLQRVAAQVIPEGAQDVHVVESGDIPTDRTFRDAWTHQAGAISVDMPAARNIHRDTLRRAREPMLKVLDVEWQRAQESNDNELMSQVATGKQLLRDAPAHPDIEAAQTPEELKAIWPLDIVGPMKLPAPQPAPMPAPRAAGHTTGWIGSLVGKIKAAEDELAITMPAPVMPEEPQPEAPYHLPAEPTAPPIPMDDAGRRRAAKAQVRRMAASFAFSSADEQLRYEEALMAHNGNVQALQTFEPEARVAGISVRELAERIIDERRLKARRMVAIKAIYDQALIDLDNASGEGIAAIEARAVAAMQGGVNADHR